MLTKANHIHSKPTSQVGFVLKPHGFKGQLKITLNEDFQPGPFLLISIHEKFVPFSIEQFNPASGIVKLEGVDDLEHAEELAGLEIIQILDELEVNSIPDLHDYTLLDLNHPETDYRVIQTIQISTQVLIEFRHGHKDCLIPMHDDIIVSIDHDLKIISAYFPEGILDL